tara:strand:- start:1891 stop:2760 length:870 start_codon:yes stop_codon:yes gene_type:complete
MARVSSTGKESSSNFSPDNGTGLAVRTALKDILESLRTINSASGDPSGSANLAAYQTHIDSDTNLLKIRNSGNSAFITLGNVSQTNFGLLPLTGGTLTGVLALSNASASAPSVHFGDSTTGLYRKGSNQIGFTFAGTERAFIDQDGLSLLGTKAARFFDSDDSHYVEIKAGTVTANRTITLPDATGTLMTTASSLFTLGTTSVTSGGTIQSVAGVHSITPATNNAHDLGSTTLRWRNIFTNDLDLSNQGGKNDVDGTWGSYKIQEGEEHLYLINKRNGKKYRFNLTEVK